MDWIRSQARVWNGIPLLSHKYRSVVHLEDKEDESFWRKVLKDNRPGEYMFIHYSKSDKGNDTTGCDQCLKFKPYLSSRFFICIDSDFRYLMGESDIDAAHYVVQTYTYSWENHCCEKDALQASVTTYALGCDFNFSIFLTNLSEALYEPLLLLLYCKRTGNDLLNEHTFRHILKTQCTGAEAQNSGQGYATYIRTQFADLLSSAQAIGFNIETESTHYKAKGIETGNAYLHVRGHNIYDLIIYIGKMCCSALRVDFVADVMLNVSITDTYWEYDEIKKDLGMI